MTFYECYRCGYNTHIKTIMLRHLERKNTCKPIIIDIEIEECKKFILNGYSYKQFLSKFSKKNLSQNEPKMSQNEPNVSQNEPNVSQNEPKMSQNEPKIYKNERECNFKCKYCSKKYKHVQSLNKHLKKCKEKEQDETVKQSMTELAILLNEKEKQLKEELDKKDKQICEQNKHIEQLIKRAGIITNNNITNVQNNIKLLNYNDTDTSDLTENDYVKCLEHYNFCIPHLIRRIHFNPKKPENHNIYISNLKNSYVMIYTNNKWKVKNRDDTITELIDDKQVLLEQKIQEWVNNGNKYPRIMAKFSRYIEKRENNKVLNAIKEDIKLTLYNNRNMIIFNHKLLENE